MNLQMSNTFAAFQDICESIKVSATAELLTNRGVINQVHLPEGTLELSFLELQCKSGLCLCYSIIVVFIVVYEGSSECHEGLPERHQIGPDLLLSLLQCSQCLLPHQTFQAGQLNVINITTCWQHHCQHTEFTLLNHLFLQCLYKIENCSFPP